MRILIAANNDVGLYKFRKELLETLLKEHEVIISLPNGALIETMEAMGCVYEACSFDRHGTNPISELKQLAYYRTLLKRIQPDMVLTYTIKPNVYAGMACAALGITYLANITGLGTVVENPGLMQKITVQLYKFGLRKAQKVFFQNAENMAFMLEKGIVKGDYQLIPGSGVNLRDYTVADYPQGDTIDFVFIARIMREKGIEQYVEAAKYIRKKYPQTRFHICGAQEPGYNLNLEALAQQGIVIYHGLVMDMKTIYGMAACTIHPTYYPEGLSNVLLESCASGRPIITTDRSGCREVVDDGVNGFVVKQKDAQDLIEKIEAFLALSQEQRAQMGRNGRAKVEREFSRDIIIEAYMDEVNRKNV